MAPLEIISVVIIDRLCRQDVPVCVSLDISTPTGMASMIIDSDFGSDCVTFSPSHRDVQTYDDGQP